jgi:hypothetical protein
MGGEAMVGEGALNPLAPREVPRHVAEVSGEDVVKEQEMHGGSAVGRQG